MCYKTILVVEDSDMFLEVLSEMLSLHGYQIIPAVDGQAALEIAQTLRPDAILCDIGVPLLDGYEIFDELQRFEHTAQIPLIFVTGRSSVEEIHQKTGISRERVLLKPFMFGDLAEILLGIWDDVNNISG